MFLSLSIITYQRVSIDYIRAMHVYNLLYLDDEAVPTNGLRVAFSQAKNDYFQQPPF